MSMICTFLTSSEQERFVSVPDKELNELFQEVRKHYNGDSHRYYLEERIHVYKKWFKKPVETKSYSLYYDRRGDCEVVVVNFPPEEGYSSLNTNVSKATMMTYFYGLLSGLNYKK